MQRMQRMTRAGKILPMLLAALCRLAETFVLPAISPGTRNIPDVEMTFREACIIQS
jgi:hypothetical protein